MIKNCNLGIKKEEEKKNCKGRGTGDSPKNVADKAGEGTDKVPKDE